MTRLDAVYEWKLIIEPRHEKTNILHMRKQYADQLRGDRKADQRLCFDYTQMVARSIRRLMTSPFKTMYFQNFCKKYCCKTIEATIMKNISNDSKLI